MRVVLLCVFLIAAVSAKVKPLVDYHEQVGIPLATRIKEAEDAIHARAAKDGRIVGGAVAPFNAYPYLVKLFFNMILKFIYFCNLCIVEFIFKNKISSIQCRISQTFYFSPAIANKH